MPFRVQRLKLTIAYDGGHFEGWQTQATGTGVQSLIEKAFNELVPKGAPHQVHGASRTDSGVHALGMVAHVDVDPALYRLTMRRSHLALNARLPDAVRVISVSKVSPQFHARYHAKGKQYRYSVWNHSVMNPMLRDVAWHVAKRIDADAMRAAAKLLIGMHDFRSFAKTHPYVIEDTVRNLWRVDVRKSGPLWTFIIEGDGFLYRMCRGIVGTLIQVGHGFYSVDEVKRMLEAKDRTTGGMSAPAWGLTLWKVLYPRRGEPLPNFSHRRVPRTKDSRARTRLEESIE